MLELLEKREDEHFEGFCQALEATGHHGVVQRYLQEQRVGFMMMKSCVIGLCMYEIIDF